jgi:hypothetical protein
LEELHDDCRARAELTLSHIEHRRSHSGSRHHRTAAHQAKTHSRHSRRKS